METHTRDPLSSIGLSSGNPVEERKEGLGKPVGGRGEGIEDITRQLTGTTNQNQRNSQSLNQQPGSLQETDLGPLHICDRYVA